MSQFVPTGSEKLVAGEKPYDSADWRAIRLSLLAGLALLPILVGIFVQGPEYDESIMMLTVSGHTVPVWPRGPVAAAEVQGMFADRASLATLLSDIRNTDVHPPLHYVAAWLVHLVAGPNITAQRLLSLVLIAGCLFLLLDRWRLDAGGDFPSAAVFVLLFTLGPASYYAGSTARGYALVMFLLAAAYVALRRLAAHCDSAPLADCRGPSVIVGGGTGLAVLTHYLAAVPAGILGFTALVLLMKRRNWPGLAALLISAALPTLLSIWFLMHQIDMRGGYEPVEFPGFSAMLTELAVSLFLRVPNESMPLPEGIAAMLFAAIPTSLALVGAATLIIRNRSRFMQLGLPILIIVLYMLGLAIQQWATGAPLGGPRYLVIVWPFAAIVLAHGALWYRRRFRAGMAVAASLIGACILQDGLALASTPGDHFKYIVKAAEAHTGNAMVMIDRGYGRGNPASIGLAASAQTVLWIVTPEILKAPAALKQLRDYDGLYVAISAYPQSSEPVSQWLDSLPDRAPYVERDTDIRLHRRFIRQPGGE